MKLWNKGYILILVVNTVAFLSFQILIPLVPLYGLRFTEQESQIGVLAAAIAVAALCMRPFSGVIADRYDSNRILVLTQLGTAAVIAFYILAPGIGALIALRLAQGLLFSLGSTVIVTAAIRTMPEGIMGRGIGILTVTGMGSQAIAPIIGLWIVEKWDYPVLFIFTSLIAVAAAVIALATKVGKADTKAKEPVKRRFSPKDLFAVEAAGLTGLAVILAASTSLPVSFIVLFALTRGIPNIGLFFTINTIALVLIRLFGSGLIDRYSYRQILPFGAALCAASLAIIGSATSFLPISVAAVLMGVGYGISAPTILTNMIRAVAPARIGTASATYYFGIDLAYVAGPLAMGFIAEAASFSAGFYIFVLPTLMAIPLTFILSRKEAASSPTGDVQGSHEKKD